MIISNIEKFYKKFASDFFAAIQEKYKEKYNKTLQFTIKRYYRSRNFVEVEAKIEEIPQWLFGVWFTKRDKYIIHYDFFAQYEDEIDKFRPSHSEIRVKDDINIKGKVSFNMLSIVENINFIMEEPALSFARDYYGWNYNKEYHTRLEAQKLFDKYLKGKANEREWVPKCRQIILDYIIEKVMPYLPEFCIVDKGDTWSPRFEIIAPYKIFKDGTKEDCGAYDIEYFIKESGGNGADIMKGWEKTGKEAEKIAKKHNVRYYATEFNDCSVDIVPSVKRYLKTPWDNYQIIYERGK